MLKGTVGRPTNATDSVLLAREWLYNSRSELAAASIGTNLYGYSYDTIGNRLWSADNMITNSYSANCLNKYTTVGRAVPSAPQTSLAYDADGNMTRDGTYVYSYDAENRLRSVISRSMTNGALRVLNAYDHHNRRIRKTVQRLHVSVAQPPAMPVEIREWQTLETRTFVWDGNNIVFEKVEFANGTTRTFEYFWGVDKSGSEQGAGGVGGLLAVSLDGVFYIPCYDHNGNIVLYISETGAIAAQYTYDPYGNIIESNGSYADVFSFGFSTKYHDHETDWVCYQQRFYLPSYGRWLNRDPIEEDGGENLYAFCVNNPVFYFDTDGRFVMPIVVIPQGSFPPEKPRQSPSAIDQLGSGTGPFYEEEWFEENYAGWINASKQLFINEINNAVDCKSTQLNIRSSRQVVSPGVAGNIPWEMPSGGNDRQYGDKGQNNWQTVMVLGRFAIDYVTPVMVQYGPCNERRRTFSWGTIMYIDDTLGLQGDEGWFGSLFGWAARSRRVRRAQWRINGSGVCSCCE